MTNSRLGVVGAVGVVLAVCVMVLVPGLGARQAAVQIDGDDIGGVVTGPNGPEAGVWVIAETTDLPTRFNRTVVTDDQGRYVVPDLPAAQKAALHLAVRKPLVTTNVAIRNWRAFQKLGVSSINCPGMFYQSISVDLPPAIGGYQNASTPDEPVVLYMSLTARILEKAGSGLPPREQWKESRAELEKITFETFEGNIREQLDRVLGPGGFDAQRDVAGIIINRWGHAYASGSNELYDPDYSHRMDAPWVVGRQQFGRITISNSDAAGVSLTNAAWQQSHRAVNELITNVVRPVFDFQWSERDTAGEPGDYPNNF